MSSAIQWMWVEVGNFFSVYCFQVQDSATLISLEEPVYFYTDTGIWTGSFSQMTDQLGWESRNLTEYLVPPHTGTHHLKIRVSQKGFVVEKRQGSLQTSLG